MAKEEREDARMLKASRMLKSWLVNIRNGKKTYRRLGSNIGGSYMKDFFPNWKSQLTDEEWLTLARYANQCSWNGVQTPKYIKP
jgi:hypothetical protein